MSIFHPNVPRSRYRLGKSHARGLLLGLTLAGTVAVVGVGYIARQGFSSCGFSKADIAVRIAKKYALEAYPAFRHAHPERACPHDLAELSEWMNTKDTKDPYGNSYVMHCSGDGIVVRSAGEDAIWGTGDDVWSDR
jgi:hypothetical protein